MYKKYPSRIGYGVADNIFFERRDDMSDKTLQVHVIKENGGQTLLNDNDCQEICRKVGKITDADVKHAEDILIAKLCREQFYNIYVDIDYREAEYTPARDMTIAEIEKELGYKVKIVKE